jgi:uncharacterized membrane protein
MKTVLFVTIIILALVLPYSQANARSDATYQLVQSYIGPGGSGSAGIYTVSSSVGQPAAGEVSAGSYTLGGGFWGGGIIVPVAQNYTLFLPLLMK